ncbi:BTAD domain-containing putative transcriptional regulator [Lentzea sp. BCCO 10_0856]|uniref:BTAD domain-containing putative transcriptional regulator n=1 Tax=Lentzea miocenica TaxID=3095431 RepID=A0ABU4SWL6_9PSEU|nr:BTAD domain-containing putative transcriptional regulator [Lentzea sp. BCCO 10_0856]MDX8030296.1 BTAD domain-containing putative transcriptional regulator [Lentzea sp. BCCO 10_0856]
MEFLLLGGTAVLTGGRALDLGPARQRCVLAALAVDAGQVVSVDRLMERVWGENPPLRARATLLNYLSRLRPLLAGAGASVIARRSGGYCLEVERSTIDLHRFTDLCAQARSCDDDGKRAAVLEQALEQWHGEPLTGVTGEWAEAERDRLNQQHLNAECDLTDVLLRLGDTEDLVAPLSARAAQWPLDERVAGQFMEALHRAGRTADALAHYRQLRGRLVDELGTDPCAALQSLHQRILTGEAPVRPTQPVPRQLPALPLWFTGRGAELARLDEALKPGAATVVISAIGGAGGIGKTWLALWWAHQHADLYPDGQLFTDLRGFNPTEQPVAPDAALFGFLTALGVSPDRVPAGLDTKAALYRSLVADRRMLIVLDNANDSEQVVPLLPGSAACTVLVTSRQRPASLIDRHGSRHLPLGALTHDEARALLTARLGTDRVAAEPDSVEELLDVCGGYPLALSITARHASRPGIRLSEIAAELRELGLKMLDHDTDPAASLPAVLSCSLRRLSDEHRTVFGLLGISPGPDTTLPAVVALTGLPPDRARRALSVLEEASLLERRPHGRYAMHDLVRAYAATTAHDLHNDVRLTALTWVMDFHLHTAHAADLLLNLHRPLVHLDPPAPGVHPQPLPAAASAMTWLDAEHATLLATQRTAAALGRHHVVWHLAWALDTFHVRRGHRHDAVAVWRTALGHLPDDPTARSRAHRSLGNACSRLGLHEEAVAHLDQALDLAVLHRDLAEQAHSHRALASAWGQRGHDRQALNHARQALDLHRAADQPVEEAHALNQVGWYAAALGDFDTARARCHDALSLHRQHRYPDGEAATLDSLGFIAHRAGDHQAVDDYHRALALRRALGDAYEVANSLDGVGHPLAALGRHEQARGLARGVAAVPGPGPRRGRRASAATTGRPHLTQPVLGRSRPRHRSSPPYAPRLTFNGAGGITEILGRYHP